MSNNFESYLYQRVFPQQPPQIIYHYTTQEGILGIISKREMWATQVHFLNDKNEIFLTFHLLKEELESQIQKSHTPIHKRQLKEIREFLDVMDQGHICIASFCEVGDLLSQWRGYGNLGKGYAIGFDLKELTRIAKKHDFVLWPCVYDRELQKELVRFLIEIWCHKFSGKKTAKAQILKQIDADICHLAPIIKDESFSEEKEWRLVSSTISPLSPRFAFRVGQYSLIPYYNFPIIDENNDNCIDSIVVGPSPHQELACNSLLTFLESQRLSEVVVETSKIPFRNWK
ncbi:MAG: DUF2971 domain-containing protein [Candidatus Rifleibacteriota bacterium]